jgi:hypothetical protein
VPDWLAFVVLILAAYRLTRLAGWDDFPLAVKLRAAVIGQRWVQETWAHNLEVAPWLAGEGEETIPDDEAATVALPGKQPPTEAEGVRPAYDRPTLAHLIHCPFCVGFWISLVVVVGWLLWHDLAYGLLPFAVSGAVGLIAKNLD